MTGSGLRRRSRRTSLFRAAVTLTASFVVAITGVLPSVAQGRVAVVRDAEIEALLQDYARPIFAAAGLTSQNIEIVLVNNRSFNAFVDGRRIFINTGALLLAETPGEIIGVLAHEAGHIAGGHQARLREQIARAQVLGVVGGLLGIGAVAAGSLSDSSGTAQAGAGLATASGSVAQRSLLNYRRGEEMNADQAAIRYLDATGQSGVGMLATFRRFQQGLALAGIQADPYELSHPLPRERIAMLEQLVSQSPYVNAPTPPVLQMRHDLMRGKIAANVGGQSAVDRAFNGNRSNIGWRYGEAIATHLAGAPGVALQKIDALIAEQPSNAYFHEIRGEILLGTQRESDAAASFEQASRLDGSNSGLIRAQRGFALSNSGDAASLDQAIADLRAAISADPQNFNAYRQLAQAYDRAGDIANAELTIAEGHFRSGNRRDALVFAARAQQKFQQGTPGWIRANDILTVAR